MQPTSEHETAMRLAIAASRQALANGDSPYGATLVSAAGQPVHTALNRQHTTADCTAHAELMLVREATARFGPEALAGGTVYASGEPCAMCAGAMFWAGVRRIVFAAPNDAMGELMGGNLLPIRCAEVLANASPAVEVVGPVLADEALAVLHEAVAKKSN